MLERLVGGEKESYRPPPAFNKTTTRRVRGLSEMNLPGTLPTAGLRILKPTPCTRPEVHMQRQIEA